MHTSGVMFALCKNESVIRIVTSPQLDDHTWGKLAWQSQV